VRHMLRIRRRWRYVALRPLQLAEIPIQTTESRLSVSAGLWFRN
jgi:hypothetical protein